MSGEKEPTIYQRQSRLRQALEGLTLIKQYADRLCVGNVPHTKGWLKMVAKGFDRHVEDADELAWAWKAQQAEIAKLKEQLEHAKDVHQLALAAKDGEINRLKERVKELAPDRFRQRLKDLQTNCRALSFLPKLAQDAEEEDYDVIQLEMASIWSILDMRQFILALGEQWEEQKAKEQSEK